MGAGTLASCEVAVSPSIAGQAGVRAERTDRHCAGRLRQWEPGVRLHVAVADPSAKVADAVAAARQQNRGELQ